MIRVKTIDGAWNESFASTLDAQREVIRYFGEPLEFLSRDGGNVLDFGPIGHIEWFGEIYSGDPT